MNVFLKSWQPGLVFAALALLGITPVMAASTSGKNPAVTAKNNTSQVKTVDGIYFGNDKSKWANDGECDDPRFTGTGSAVELLDEDTGRDATDCLTLYQAGEVSLIPKPADIVKNIDFGDNTSEWANDTECDDPRFVGKGMADELVQADLGKDANDCRTLFLAGSISYLGDDIKTSDITFDGINFGDNTSEWANDKECDDPRFVGKGMAEVLENEDLNKDANDCLTLYKTGSITLSKTGQISKDLEDSDSSAIPDFGDDSSKWNNDGECDDPRFVGKGVGVKLLFKDMGKDATDCRTLFEAGQISLINATNFDFGNDSSEWNNDGECDDPRFEGEGSSSKLDPRDFASDATDCKKLFNEGKIKFIGGIAIMTSLDYDGKIAVSGVDFGDDTSKWAKDSECDDPRFKGTGMAEILMAEDLGKDATDCRALFEDGKISLK